MSSRRELHRVEQYAQGLGIKITYKKQEHGDPEADWALDGKEITVYKRNRQSITQIILDLIHELGHHMHWVYNNRKIPIKVDTALSHNNHTKKHRYDILVDERNGAMYHLVIHKELGLNIPIWKVEVERDLALGVYNYYYINNSWPSNFWRDERKKELIAKYRK